MSAAPFSIAATAGWADMDANAHMANFAYLNKCVDARMGFFKQHGFPVTEFAKRRIGPVVRRDELEYHREVGLLEPITVTLASPDTSERLCRPLETHGTESCSIGNKAIVTTYRWAKGTPEFPSLAVYREYVVNHEVGHVLGHHHEQCPGKGKVAPVMQQQTIKVAPCRPNGWPFP